MELNGIAHTQLTVSNFAACVEFYRPLLKFFEMKTIIDMESYFYCVGSRTGVAISPCAPEFAGERFQQQRIGLHHLCFRARSREDIDGIHTFLLTLNAKIVHPPQEDSWAPGYYSVLFEDPDGTRLEACFVPGRGHLVQP